MNIDQINKVYIKPTLKLGYGYYLIQKSLIEAVKNLKQIIHGNVLDLGCGVMPYKQFLLEAGTITKYTGIDLANSEYHNKVVPDAYWDGYTIPFNDNEFDFVIATEFLEHYYDTAHILTEIRRVLKPGGQLFFSVPYIYSLHEVPYDHHRFTPYALKTTFEKTGFISSEIYPRGGFNYSLLIMMSLWAKQAGSKGFIRLCVKFFMFCFHKQLIKNDRAYSTNTLTYTDFQNHTMPSGLWGYAKK
ncbi:MAG: class I SAM-dependent methyltransferase [Chitinophagaceae bacterium]|jgi:SAM-dependent methyltransferase|nr:class I SAM-dependent methyltransferase [Chitinophagaceae bacterium]